MQIELSLLRLARDGDGVVTRAMLIDEGWSPAAIDRRVAAGLLVPMFRGVYRVAGLDLTYRGRARAAWLWGGERALLAGATVLALRGLEGFHEPPIELYVPNGKSAPGIRKRRLVDLQRRPLDGMETTTIERALLDACVHHPAAKVGKAMDDALRKRMTTVERLRTAIPLDGRGPNGTRVFRRLIRGRDLNDMKVRSEMETRMLRILRRIENQTFVPNFEVHGRTGRYFLDFAFPRAFLGIECHSRRWHGPERVSGDLARDRDLKAIGWIVLYYTWDDIVFRPHEVHREIEEFLAELPPDGFLPFRRR